MVCTLHPTTFHQSGVYCFLTKNDVFQKYLGHILRADVCKYRPEAYNKENIKILKKIHKVALGELLTEIYFLLRSDNCFRRTEVVFVSQLSDLAFRVSHSASRKAR